MILSKEKFIELPLCAKCNDIYCGDGEIAQTSLVIRPHDIFSVVALDDDSSCIEIYGEESLAYHVKATKAQVLWLAFKVRDVETIDD